MTTGESEEKEFVAVCYNGINHNRKEISLTNLPILEIYKNAEAF